MWLSLPSSASVFVLLDGTLSWEVSSVAQRQVTCLLCVSGLRMASLSFQLYDCGPLTPTSSHMTAWMPGSPLSDIPLVSKNCVKYIQDIYMISVEPFWED